MSEVFTFLIKTQPTIHDFETTQVKEIMSQQKFASADNKYQLNIFYVAIFISLPQHLIGFIQFCCWKNRTLLDFNFVGIRIED